MLPINTNASARDTIKADHISSNNHQGSEPATDENYQEILSSLEQEPASADSGQQDEQNQQQMPTENQAGREQLASDTDAGDVPGQQAAMPQPALLADKAPEQVSARVADSQLIAEENSRQAASRINAAEVKALDADINQLADGEATVRQTQEQVQLTQGKQPAVSEKNATQTIPTVSTEQIAQNLSQAVSEQTAATSHTIDTGKQAEQASQSSNQAVSLLYRQQELQNTGKLSVDQMQLMTEQSTALGNKGLANTGTMLNKLDGMQASMLQGDIRGITDLSGGKVPVEGLTSTSGQSQTQVLAMDATLAERSQTANGKYEWSMLKLDSQKQNWSRQLFNTLQDRIEMQANQQIKQAKIRLDPPELGRLELIVRIEGDRMSVSVNASNSSVREALQETNERLRQELENQFGSSVDVNVGSDSSDQAFKNEEELVAVSNVEATEINHSSVPLTTGWLNALA